MGTIGKLAVLALVTSTVALAAPAAPAQDRDRSRPPAVELPSVLRSNGEQKKIRHGQVGIVTGQPSGVYARLGADLLRLLNDRSGSELRISAVIGQGSISNIDDLLNLGGIDFAILQSDVLKAYHDTETGEKLQDSLRYVSRLHTEYLHILTRRDVIGEREPTVCVLAGKRINVGGRLSGTWLTVRSILEERIRLDLVYDDSASTEEGIAQLKAGTVDAVAFVVGKPAPIFEKLSATDILDNGFELLAIEPDLFVEGCNGVPPAGTLEDTPYEPVSFTPADYENFVAPGHVVPTVGVPSVLAAYAWEKWAPRYRTTSAFVHAFFDKAPKELARSASGYDRNWCDVNLGQSVGGWKRLDAAAEWMRDNAGRSLRIECSGICEDKDKLNADFAVWLKQQPGPQPSVQEIVEKFEKYKEKFACKYWGCLDAHYCCGIGIPAVLGRRRHGCIRIGAGTSHLSGEHAPVAAS